MSFTMQNGQLAGLHWNVESITGHEAVNELFRFEAVLTAAREEVARYANPLQFHRLLPKHDVRFSLGDPPSPGTPPRSTRYAMISAAHHGGFHRRAALDEVYLRLELVPRAWLLTQRRNSRIFQDRFVHEIVSAVLYEHGIRHRWDLQHRYPRRLYCTQYQETDCEFVTRLFAEEGILFYFQHGTDFSEAGPARHVPEHTTEDDFRAVLDVVDIAAKVGGGLSSAAGSIAGAAGSEEVEGAMAMTGAAFGMAGDAARALYGLDDTPVLEGGVRGHAGPAGDGDVLFFTDANVYGECLDADGQRLRITLERASGMVALDSRRIDALESSRRAVPERVEIRDYDFRKPLLLLKKQATDSAVAVTDLEIPAQPGPLEQYEHHGEYETHDITQETADIQLEQHRRELATYSARSRSPHVFAGHWFELVDVEDHEHHGASAVVAVRVHHELHAQARPLSTDSNRDLDAMVKACARAVHRAARAPELGEEQLRDTLREVLASPPAGGIVYQSFVTCVANEEAFRPPRPPRVIRNVTESATVMGPPGKDIYTDRFGRVKVQFHWDREGKFDDKTSVWMRVVQPWSGAGFGFQFFPRVGMEVLVTFLGGDPDRPVVVGSLYNGTHPTPEPLPERMTRSGIRTQSTPKGGGFNELSFDDANGTERVYLHAERDFDAVVNHSHDLKVKHAHTLEVGARHHVGVEGEQLVSVGGMQSTLVGEDQSCCVAGSRRDRVVGNVATRVEGNLVDEVRGVALHKVDGHEIAFVRGHHDLTVLKDATLTSKNAWAFVNHKMQLSAGEIAVMAPSNITFRVGESFIRLEPDYIHIEADELELVGRDRVQIVGTEVISRTESGAMVRLRAGQTLLRGSEIAMSSPESAGGHLDPATHPINVRLRFTHLAPAHGGEPIANTDYAITTPTKGIDDLPVTGTTNDNGELELHVPDDLARIDVLLGAQHSYPDIYPGAAPLRFVVLLKDSLGEADTLEGARIRLRNLGYHPGEELEQEELDAATRQALLAFQVEAETATTGELDDATKRKLRDIYGS